MKDTLLGRNSCLTVANMMLSVIMSHLTPTSRIPHTMISTPMSTTLSLITTSITQTWAIVLTTPTKPFKTFSN